jgi:hypothetical protein
LLVDKALAANSGSSSFSVSGPSEGLFDGLRHTYRSAQARRVEVEVATLDSEWENLGCPEVSIIKIDVEGGELDVLRGGYRCLERARPAVLLEWCPLNFRAYHNNPGSLLDIASKQAYSLFALPWLLPVTTATGLNMQLLRTESFLMVPNEGRT